MSGTNPYITSAAYNASDQITTLAFQSGTTTTYTYDPNMLRLTLLVTSNNIQNLGYTYDNVGNVKTITNYIPATDEVTTFNYDDLNRLLSANIPSVYAQSWQYDAIGNMKVFTDGAQVKSYVYNDAAHKHAITQIGLAYYCYDANGNMTKRRASNSTCTTGGDTLTYDQENRLTSITVGANTTTYAYDGDGNRVKKVAGGTTTFYVGNHYEVTNNVSTKYYYFGKQRVAMRNASGVTYLHSDHLGSTSVTTNVSGQCTSAQWYYAYGNIRTPAPSVPCSGAPPTDFGFTGQRRDANVSLLYYGARYYDATLGRFVSADTVVPSAGNPQSLNRYAYVLNNPLKYIDPSGHDFVIVGGGAGEDLSFWEGWIRAYKGWGYDDAGDRAWNDFYSGWQGQTSYDARTDFLASRQIQFMNWSAVNPSNPDDAAKHGDLDKISAVLDSQLQGKTNNILFGHSRGGKVIEWYLGQYAGHTAQVDAAILVEAPTSLFSEIGGDVFIGANTPPSSVYARDAWFVQGIETRIVTVNNFLFPGGGLISGAENFQTLALDGGEIVSKQSTHGPKNFLAGAVFDYLRGRSPSFGGLSPYPWYHTFTPFNPGPF